MKKEREIAIWDEVLLMLRINTLLTGIGIETIYSAETGNNFSNEIQIGGPVSNEFTNRHFQQYLKGIKWVVTKAHLRRYKVDQNLKQLNYDFIDVSKNGKQGFMIGDEFYEYIPQKKGWSIIIKLVDKSSVPSKTIHLLFGCGANGTNGAVSYFVDSYSDIYKRNQSRPYICIFEVNGKGKRIGHISYLSNIKDYFKYNFLHNQP